MKELRQLEMYSHNAEAQSYARYNIGGSHGLVVKGGDPNFRGNEFES